MFSINSFIKNTILINNGFQLLKKLWKWVAFKFGPKYEHNSDLFYKTGTDMTSCKFQSSMCANNNKI